MKKGKKGHNLEYGEGGNASNRNGDDAEEERKEDDDDIAKKERVNDPDGSLGIARGMSRKEAAEQREELLKRSQTAAAQAQLWGSQVDAAKERLLNLQRDDKRPDLGNLNPKQTLALKKRRRRGDKIIQAKLERFETKRLKAAVDASDAAEILQTDQAGILEVEHDMERTTALTQTELKRKYLDADTAKQIFDLKLTDSAPYGMEYDRSGRFAVMYGQKGHLALMDCHEQSLQTEFYVNERVRDACFLHNYTLFAAAQKNHVFIYDNAGAEVHRLADHTDPSAMQFLPYHWLLASIGRAGWLKYQDTSTGQLVSQHRTRLGPCRVLRQNPANAVLHAGHSNGVVTFWSPSTPKYLVKMLCHKGGAVHSLAVDLAGRTMVTGGADRQVRVWDLRMYKELHSYYCAAGVPTSMDISQRGILAIGHAGHATCWSAEALKHKVKNPYMHHALPGSGPVQTIRFRAFQDVCGIGHQKGISSIVIPGSGEPSLDTAEYNTNPHQDLKQRREAEVQALLDKLSPSMIALDPDQVGGIEESDPHRRLERLRDLAEDANSKEAPIKKKKNKKRGRSKIQTQLRGKRKNIVDQNTIKLREAREKEIADRAAERNGEDAASPKLTPKEEAPAALKRFF